MRQDGLEKMTIRVMVSVLEKIICVKIVVDFQCI